MSVNLLRPPDEEALATLTGGLDASQTAENTGTLAALPVGARLIVRCRKDWRVACVAAVTLEKITLTISSPSGHTYRLRRPPDSPLSFDGSIPVLGEGQWRAGLARYDRRW